MLILIRFIFLLTLKIIARIFWRFDIRLLNDFKGSDWPKLRLMILLNHTSLYEWVYCGVAPVSFLWRVARHGIFPGAQETLARPLVGLVFKMMAAYPVSISRKRDASWDLFMRLVKKSGIVLFLPEGRMRRHKGLDKFGKPMSVRSGIWDLLSCIGEGHMLIAYSGGLHHVQFPGRFFPRLFKTITIGFELVDIAPYLDEIRSRGATEEEHVAVVRKNLDRKRDDFLQIFRPELNFPLSKRVDE